VNSYQQYGPGQNQRLFGFSYKENELEEISKISPVPPNMDDGVTVAAGGLYGYAIDLDQQAGRDYELIRRYRCMALHPEIDSAIENIINEAIVSDTNDSPVAIDLSNLDVSERIKTIIREEFQYILHLLDLITKPTKCFEGSTLMDESSIRKLSTSTNHKEVSRISETLMPLRSNQ